MSRVTLAKTNFTAGELAREMLGRTDLSAYANGALTLQNVVIAPTGGVSRRPGLRYVDTARGPGRLVAFEFNTQQAYLLVFTDRRLDVYANGAWQAGLATDWTAAHIANLNWAQTADTLLVVHPDVRPKKITRTSHTSWTITDWSYPKDEDKDVIHQPYHKFAADEVTLDPSSTSGTVAVVASADVFTSQHVGRRLRLRGKEAAITAVTDARHATATLKEALTTHAPTTDWEEEAFSDVHGWPISVCFHQDRLVVGGSRDAPNRLWMSASGDLSNFDIGTGLDDEAIEFGLLSDQVDAIRGVASGRHLQVFTSGAEWMVSGAPLTPTRIQVSRQTQVGSPVDRTVRPRDVDGATLFASRDGRSLREFLFTDAEQAYQSTDLSMLAHHLVSDPLDQDYDPGTRLFHMVMADGTMSTLTLYRSEKVTGWTSWRTDGAFTAVAVVAGNVYVLVQRGALTLVERFDPTLALDAALTGTATDPRSTWSGLSHLEGRTVRVLADDGIIVDATVAGGAVTLVDPARSVQAGLPFTHVVEPLPPAVQGGGGGPGGMARLVRASFRLLDTRALHVDTGKGPSPIAFRRYGIDGFDRPPPGFSGDVTIRAIGWMRDAFRPLWRIEQDAPLPCTVLAVATEIKLSDQ
ncbi:MAG: hypothetical protein ACM33T_01675 [Solirubrobacterales bacterium]